MPRALPRAFFTRKSAGFTLIELMIVVAIVAILAGIAVPNYMEYVKRGNIPDATSGLATRQAQMEQYFQDHLKYTDAPACGSDNTSSKFFDFSCVSAATASAYTLQAVGKGSMANFTYTINQAGTKTSTITASGWAATSTTCWITKKGGVC